MNHRSLVAAVFLALIGSLTTSTIAANPLNADRAMGYLEAICDLGPRPTGANAMREQIELVKQHFESLGWDVEEQAFRGPHPLGKDRVRMTNLIARWAPERSRRILLCAHYDTRPFPDRDPNPIARRRGRFIGANDGASGVAALMELAHHIPEVLDQPPVGGEGVGVDIALFDAEEFVYSEQHPYFLGSRWFAMQYKKRDKSKYSYEWGVLLDMVGDADLQIYQEVHSWRWRDTRPLVKQVWETAARLGVDEFVPRPKFKIKDDHMALREIGGISCINIIDFDYPAWHTEQDTAAKCSGESLAKVGWVVLEWLREVNQR